jgi:hypothetical protein
MHIMSCFFVNARVEENKKVDKITGDKTQQEDCECEEDECEKCAECESKLVELKQEIRNL